VSGIYINHEHQSSSKRLFDILLSLVGLVFLSPLWAIVWIAVVMEDGFPVLLRQKRIGKNGVHFDSFKLRSMDKAALSEEISTQAKEDDPRITGIGRILRNTAMDESPQLINILLGEMSFVGPRPLLQSEVEVNGDNQYIDIRKIPGYEQRSGITPGLTGLAQLYHSRDIPREEKFHYDLQYIKQRSLLLDLKLIALSFLVTFTAKWETRKPKLSWLHRNH